MTPLFKLQSSYSTSLPFAGTKVKPTPLNDSFLMIQSQSCGQLLGLSNDFWQDEIFKNIVSGEYLPDGGCYFSQVYAGHQFGHFVPQLGDGRAIAIGEITNEHNQTFEIQLKGAGLTPYSRMGDGRAVLRSCIREYLASEAMAALGIPTTRALSIVGSEEPVYRETVEKGAIMARVAQSHIRFGHFEYWFHQNKLDELNMLADYCLEHFYPEALCKDNPHLYMFEQIVTRTATLIAQWQAHGFAHGVMNTDNMSIIGLTIDYGPFGFLDDYNPSFICNHSDSSGRYAFDQQPSVGLWNLNALALTFSTWLTSEEITTTLKQYEPCLVGHYLKIMQQKLGLANWQESDQSLLGQLLGIMAQESSDYSLSFRLLNTISVEDADNVTNSAFIQLFNDTGAIKNWLQLYRERLSLNSLGRQQRIELQNSVNAQYILRNYLAQSAIELSEKGDYSMIEELQKVLSSPFINQPGFDRYAATAPDWGKLLEISCSS
jgi:protein adenylyltransferase